MNELHKQVSRMICCPRQKCRAEERNALEARQGLKPSYPWGCSADLHTGTAHPIIAAVREECVKIADSAHAIEWEDPEGEYALGFTAAAEQFAAAIRSQT